MKAMGRSSAGAARSTVLLCLALLCQACSGSSGGSQSPAAASGPQFSLVLESIGPGVSSTPAQNASYADGTVVTYAFTARDGLSSVYLTLNGAPVALSGTVTMNRMQVFRAALDTAPGSRAPDFTGVTADGQVVRLSDYRGRVVFVDFSAITCEGSINEAPALRAHYNNYHSRGLEIITVLADCPALHDCPDRPATTNDLRTWQQTYGLSFPVVSDQGNVTKIFNYNERDKMTAFPAGYIIDGAGVIRNRFSGFDAAGISAALSARFP